MISEIKSIRKSELENLIKESEQEIGEIQEGQLSALLKERSRLTSPDIVRNFNWFQKKFTKRREYKEYVKTAIENKAKLPVLEEDIAFCENKIADAKQRIGNANRKIIRFQTASSLEELEVESFQEAADLLKTNSFGLVLEKGDHIYTQVPTKFRDISDFCFIYKTNTLPFSAELLSKHELGKNTQTDILLGETFQSLSVKDWEKTVHGTINGTNHDIRSQYAILSPFEKIDKTKLISAMPNNTFFDSSIPIPENSYLVVPQDEMSLLNEEIQNNPNITIVGYNNHLEEMSKHLNLNNALSVLMNNLGYVEQELTMSGWDNTRNFHDFQSITEQTLENECQIDLNDVVENTKNFPFELNRFLPYRTTRYLVENSKIKKRHAFAKALEYLHENIDDFEVSEKKLKTRTVVEYDYDLLKSNPKDSSKEKTDDVFEDFIDILKSRKVEDIDNYLSIVSDRYIPDKKELRDELLKSTSRLKNDAPIRNAFFSNIFERFIGLELEKELETEVEQAVPPIPEVKGLEEIDAEINEFGEIIRKPKEEIEITIEEAEDLKTEQEAKQLEDKEEIIERLQNVEKQEDDFEIVIEPRSDDLER